MGYQFLKNHFFFSVLIIIIISTSFILSTIALAKASNENEQKTTENSTEPAIPQKFISDGRAIEIERLGIKISPPANWEVITNAGSLSIIMQEPKIEVPENEKNYDKPKYQRNITVAVVHEPSPIDEKRAEELRQELLNSFGKDSAIKNYNIIEHKFFDYKSKNDGLLVYANFDLNEFKMMQMHVLISGAEKQFLLTYSDLAEEFSNTESFNKAWNSMVSLKVSGIPPGRYDSMIKYGAVGGAFLLLLVMLGIRRYRRASYNYISEANEIYKDEEDHWDQDKMIPTTQTGMWKLTANGDLTFDDNDNDKMSHITFVTRFS